MLLQFSGDASPLLMAGPRQVVSRNSKGSKNILMYNFIIITFDCQGGGISARAFALLWHHHCCNYHKYNYC